ncbi:MAG: choice-of-anchor J domain-containing protein, partial [Bacteroidales bacterium]
MRFSSLLVLLLLVAGGIWGQVPGPNLNEGFEDGIIPDNWTIINVDGGAQVWNAQTTNPHTGLYSARVRYETSSLNNDDWLITPPLYVTSATTDEISFWLRTYSATYADPWEVLVSTTNTNPASFTMIDSGPGMLGEYVQKTYSLDEYGDAVVYVAIRSIGAYDWYVYVDDFTGPPVMVPTCPKPTDLTAANPTINSIELGWTAGNTETMWDVLYGAAGFDPETEGTLITGIEANPYLLENLASSTVYEFYVRAVCGEDEVSLWAGPKLFNTLCTSVGLPLIENFTFVTTPALPLCWSKIIANTNNVSVNIETTTLYPVSPPYAVKLYNSSADTAELLLITPEISDPLAGNRVMFSARGGTNYSLLVGTISDPADPATFTMVGEVFPTGTHTPFQVSLADYTGTDTYIAFKHGNMGKTQTIYIDDIVIEELPDCIEPINLTVSGITNNTAVLGWTAQGSETTWDVVYGAPGFDPLTAGTTVTGITANPYTLTGLASASTYEFYVRADCGAETVSSWSGPLAFTTLCDAFELPFLENFDGAVAGTFPLCWSKAGLATTNWSISNTANALGTAPELRFGYSPSFTGEALMVSPVINTSGETSVAIEFKHYFDYYAVPFTFGMKTTSDGVNWNTIWEVIDPTANVGPETLLLSVDNGDVGSATFQFAFFVDGYTFNMDNWYMDDIHVFVPEFGTLEGTVTEATRGPVEGALITAEDYQAYTDASGYYIIENMMTGTYDVTCEAIGYFPVTMEGVEILTNQTTTQDFTLGYATISVAPGSLSQTLLPGATATQMLTISNTGGTEPLTWSAAIEFLQPDRQYVSIPAAQQVTSSAAPSRHIAEKTSSASSPSPSEAGVFEVLRGSTGYGFDMYPGNDFITFDTDTPGVYSFSAPTTHTVFAADFDQNNVFYAIDNASSQLFTVDVATGAFTLVGSTLALTDLAFDYTTNTMYAVNYDATSSLYTLDLATGATTLVGDCGAGLIISLACDGLGNLYGFNISDDALYSINKLTGAKTLIGAVGFDGNYAQSMAWDPASDIIYMAAYNNTAQQGQLRVVDKVTGATSLVGAFPAGAEVCGLGFMGATETWLTIDPISGVINPGESQDITVTFDATDLVDSTYLANININHNGQELTDGTVVVPVSMIVASASAPEPPTEPAPPIGATMVSLQPEFSWINGAGTAQVQLEIRKGTGGFASLVYKSPWFTGTSFNLADVPLTLLPKQGYSWYIKAKNAAGITTSPRWIFTTIGVGSVNGVVTDAYSTLPLEGATITIEPGGYTATTSNTGSYSIPDVLEG